MNQKIKNLLEKLENNNMKAYYVENKEEALELAKTLIPIGATIAAGGSSTNKEIGLMDYVMNGEFNFLDRNNPKLTPEESMQVCVESMNADVYLSSSNAITENGELYNIDGNCNRIAALSFGPKSVIICAGINKIVPDINAATLRLKTIAAPKNSARFGFKNYCVVKEHCISIDQGKGECIGAGCDSPTRICRTTMVHAKQKIKDRIKVILIGEELGY